MTGSLPTPDVQIFVGDGFVPDPTWAIARQIVRPEASLAQEYASEAWIAGAFQPPTSDDASRLTTSIVPPAGHGLTGVVPLDRDGAQALEAYHQRAQKGDIDEQEGLDALKRILISLSERLEMSGSIETRPPTTNSPRQLTTGRDSLSASSLRVGLRVENWSSSGVEKSLDRPNRLEMNLGPGDIWQLYVPHSVESLEALGPRNEDCDVQSILPEHHQRVPVIRILVPAGFAFVAPTEAVLHDASTLGATAPARTMSLLGRFRPRT